MSGPQRGPRGTSLSGAPLFTVDIRLYLISYRKMSAAGELTSRSAKARLAALVRRAAVPCLVAVDHFDNGAELLKAAELHGSRASPLKSDAPYRLRRRPEWLKIKTAAWSEANRDRWRAFAR